MQLLPSELKSLIAELLLSSPKSLAALARTHTAYQREAEKALYKSLSIFVTIQSINPLKCMETLATNPEKAALVRFLSFEYSHYGISKNQTLSTYLSKSLINMHSLSDFRMRSFLIEAGDSEIEAQMIRDLGRILCEGHFRLQTLYCHDVLNISQIIKSQTELQILGLYIGNPRNILITLKELHNAHLFLPIVLTLESGGFTPFPCHIGIFPAFYSADRRATIPQALAQSFCKDHMASKVDKIRELSIYLIDRSEISSISALAKDMALTFPQIGCLNLWFERGCEIPGQENKEEFSVFPNLRRVNANVWPTA